ncbi:MAG: hypothetical protein Aurels2KO_32220 [Aureliella sp.]
MLEQPHCLFTLRLDSLPVSDLSAGEPARGSSGDLPRSEPQSRVASELLAVRLPDHRKKYLDYEGPVSGNRGSVRAVARGFATLDRTGLSSGGHSPTCETETGRELEDGFELKLHAVGGGGALVGVPASCEHEEIKLAVYEWSMRD